MRYEVKLNADRQIVRGTKREALDRAFAMVNSMGFYNATLARDFAKRGYDVQHIEARRDTADRLRAKLASIISSIGKDEMIDASEGDLRVTIQSI